MPEFIDVELELDSRSDSEWFTKIIQWHNLIMPLSLLTHPCFFYQTKTLCYLRDIMSRQWPPCFLVLPMLLVWHYTTQWPSGTAPVLLTEHYAMPLITWWSTASATDLRERFLPSGAFYFALFPAFSRFPWGRQFNLKVSRASCWSSKHSPDPTNCLDHTIHKRFICGRFYSRARTGQSRNINLYGELVLQNISFEIFASYGIWALFATGEHVTRLLS